MTPISRRDFVRRSTAFAVAPSLISAYALGKDTKVVAPSEPTGKLIGKVTVQPESVVPGQPVLIQVLDPAGKVISDSDVNVIIQQGAAASRYQQFSTPGTYKITAMATRDSETDTASATVIVAGAPLAFHKSLASPAVTEIPILQVRTVLGRPYTADFTLGITRGGRRLAASTIAKATTPKQAPGAKPPADKTAPVIKKVDATEDATHTASEAKAEATSYAWDFGDGTTLTTQYPSASHDYLPSMRAGDLIRGFDVSCTVVHDKVTVKRTLLLHSAYGMCRRGGTVVPPISGNVHYASFQHVGFSGSFIVHNLEESAIVLKAAAYVPFSDERDVAPPALKFVEMKTPVSVAAKSPSALGFYVGLDQLKVSRAQVSGFTVYFSGETKDSSGKSMPVRFSCAFRVTRSDSAFVEAGSAPHLLPASWDHEAALKSVAALVAGPKDAVSKAGAQTVDPNTSTIAIALSADPWDTKTLLRVRSAIEAGLTTIALKNGAITEKGVALPLPRRTGKKSSDPKKIDPLDPPPVAPGNECYPDDISDDDLKKASAEHLACQLTNTTRKAVIPGQFQNAQQGDIILSPAPSGSGDPIATLFSVLTPPQHHSHSGMMTANFFEITHCTSSPNVYADGVTTDILGIPTGIDPNVLQYGWPGCLTQSIDDATGNVWLMHPNNKKYSFHSFDTDQQGDPFSHIYPAVVKPLPENESTVRAVLRKAADSGRAKGAQYEPGGTEAKPAKLLKQGGYYYSFYSYTNLQRALGFKSLAGADAGWAQGMAPAMCSGFVWLTLKDNGIPLVTKNEFETLADFTTLQIAHGARVGPSTLDGLIFYPQSERAVAGEALYNSFQEMDLSMEDGLGLWFGGFFNTAIAGPITNQIINNFASGNANDQSAAWRTPGTGTSVSDDNILYAWNPPYYGYSEPLQYLPQHEESYTVSKWTKVASYGSVKGKVLNLGKPVAHARVSVSDNHVAYTDADGSFALEHVGIGKYSLKASALTKTDGVLGERTNGGGREIRLTKEKPDVVEHIELQGLAEGFRRVEVVYSCNGNHASRYDQKTGWLPQGPLTNSTDVEPGTTYNTINFAYDYNGGGYYNVSLTWNILLRNDNSIIVVFKAVMNSDNTDSDRVEATPWTAIVAPGKSVSASFQGLYYSYDGVFTSYTNGPFNYNFTVTNKHQTG